MSQDLNAATVSELICTRLSHDIIGNIGAVANAVELLEEGDMEFLDDIKTILKTSSGVLSSRMKFFRLAFGLDNANLENLQNIENVLKAYLATIGSQNHPLQLDFALQNSRYSRAVMLAVMIIADTMIRGGRIEITEKDGKVLVSSSGETSPSVDKLAQIKAVLTGEVAELNAQFAPVFYLINILKQSKINLYILNSDFLGFVFE